MSSCGFWPVVSGHEAMFYESPEPDGFEKRQVQSDAEIYSNEMGEFVLP